MVLSLGVVAIAVILASGIWIIGHDSDPVPKGRDGAVVEEGVGVLKAELLD